MLASNRTTASSVVVVFAICAGVVGCATTGGGGGSGAPNFPSAAEAQALASSQKTLPKATPQIVLRSHTIAQALPPSLGETPLPPLSEGASTFDQMAQATLNNATVQATCAARELAGVIVGAPKAEVEGRLRQAIFDRCGVSNARARVQYVRYSGVPKGGLEALIKQQPDDVRDNLKTYGQSGEYSGAGAAERDDAVVLVFISHGPSPLTGVRTLSDPAQRSVVFNGVAEDDVEGVSATVTSGAYDATSCVTDESVILPKFRVTCTISADDAYAYVDVNTKVRGKMLSRFGSRAMIIANEALARTWTREVPTDAAPSSSTKGFAQATVEGVNAVRARAGRKPLRLATAQSATGDGLAAAWFAERGANDDLHERLILAMMAGWNVDAMTIGDADVMGLEVAADVEDDLVGGAQESPSLRELFFGVNSSALAVGAVDLGAGRRGVVLGSYAPLMALPADADRVVFNDLKRRRIARRHSGLGEIPVEAVMREVEKDMSNGMNFDAAVKKALNLTVQKMQLGMQAWSFTTQSLDELIFPEELLRSPQTFVAVAVAPMKPKDSPWGTYGVIIIGYVDENAKTADAGGLSAAAR